jgi:transcriptional regulator of acetoin/glycerol metabolism
VIASTNRNLREVIAKGTFREGLYYRINVLEIQLPALREPRGGHSPSCGNIAVNSIGARAASLSCCCAVTTGPTGVWTPLTVACTV